MNAARNDSVLTPEQLPQEIEDRYNTTDIPAQDSRKSNNKNNTPLHLQILATHLIVFNSFGLVQSFATLSAPYHNHLHQPPSAISWIGSTSICLAYTLAPLSTHLLRHTSHPHLQLFGAACQIAGLAIASWSHRYSVTLLSQGVLVGVGHGLTFVPAIARLAARLGASRWKMTALSVAGCGAATGGMVFAGIAQWAIKRVGLSWTLWVLGGVVGFNAVIVQGLLRWGSGESEGVDATPSRGDGQRVKKTWWKVRVLRDRNFALYTLAIFFFFAGLWIPFFYTRSFAVEALHMDPSQSFAVFMILNAAGIQGRIIPALLSDAVLGTINTYFVVLLLMGTTLFCWPLVGSSTDMFVWAGAYGFCAGGAVSLVQAGAISLCGEEEDVENCLGVVLGVAGVASLVGAPVGGELVRAGGQLLGDGSKAHLLLQLCTGGFILLACFALVSTRVLKTGWKVVVKI
ncbi:hypothetical protein EKO04_009978 [Ascochyta lentis]|uniref:MFS general substrate transporter n=1 Tax=Ascochyta lentis TaxID=205686 RepID=A0A8H7MEF0_9PLEO|nr:hypothetical protein EKO04_009978 [Ascochyta lentis]